MFSKLFSTFFRSDKYLALWAVVGTSVFPFLAHAHEVYVLNSNEINNALAAPPLDFLGVIHAHTNLFLLSSLLGIIVVVFVFGLSISKLWERAIDPWLFKIKPYAGHVFQATLGLALVASAYYSSLFGIELPLSHFFGTATSYVHLLLYVSGLAILFGAFPRIGGFALICICLYMFVRDGSYMLSYMTYFGEALVICIFGSSYHLFKTPPAFSVLMSRLALNGAKYKYFILRITFGISLIYASIYAKYLHGTLALDTIQKYHLTNYFHFEPLFIVLGAFIIELLIGVFFIIGFEIRFTSLFFLTFLTLSLFFFGEAVWPHFILIGTAIALFVHGYDRYTIEHHWYIEGAREPVL